MKKNLAMRAISLGLSGIMAVALAACGSSESSGSASQPSDSVQAATENNKTSASALSESGTESTVTEGSNETSTAVASVDISEPVDLTMIMVTDGNECPDNAEVDAAIAKIVKDKINVNLTFKRCGFTDMRTNMNLWLSSGEPCDIFPSWFSWAAYKQYYADLTPYLDLMPNAQAAIGDFISNGYDDGKLLGLPAIKDWVSYSAYLMRKDMVEETGMKPEDIKTYEQFGELLEKIKENHPDIHPLTNGTASLGTMFVRTINARDDGSQYETDLFAENGVGLMDPTTSSEVTCMYFSDFYKNTINMAYDWAEKGLIYDSGISNGAEQVMAGTAAGYGTYYKPGIESQEKVACGTDMVAVCMPDIKDGVRTTQTSFNWGVNKNCKNVERACLLLDLMFSNKEINNLMAWGLEGKHYVRTDDPNLIEYPEGIDAANVGYYNWAKFNLPNNYLQYVMDPSPSDLWEEMKVFNESGQPSKAFGFVFDRTPVEGEFAAIQNVVSQYSPGLESGTLEPSKLDDFRNDLTDAGIQTIIDEAQKQLDDWMAKQ